MSDVINIEILPDGTIKSTTDRVSAPNHANAEGFFREMARLTGDQNPTRVGRGMLQQHEHEHTHEGEGSGHTH